MKKKLIIIASLFWVSLGFAIALACVSPTSLPFGCNIVIPGTSTGVGNTCLPTADIPTLVNPHNPNSNGADNTGVNDSTAAVATTLGAGDVHFTAGTYKLNACMDCTGAGTPWSFCTTGTDLCSGVSSSIVAQGTSANYGIRPPANTNIFCDPGVILKTTLTSAQVLHDGGVFFVTNNGVTITNCTIMGSGINSPAPLLNSSNFGILISGGTNDIIQGNIVENFFGNGGIQLAPDVSSTTTPIIRYNTLLNNAYYGIVTAGLTNTPVGSIDHNLSYSNPIGAEWDACTGGTLGTLGFSNNFVRYDAVSGIPGSGVGNCRDLPAYANNCSDTAGGHTAFEGEAAVTGSVSCNYSGITFGPGNYALGGMNFQTHINGGLGPTNTGGNSVAANFPGTNFPLGANANCTNMIAGVQTCP